MNTFVNNVKMGATRTTNGMVAFESTGNELLDLFGGIGSSRNNVDGAVDKFVKAFNVDRLLATKILFWARDIRGGAGEREVVRTILRKLEQVAPDVVINNLHNVPHFGRWDDLLIFTNAMIKDHAYALIRNTITGQLDGWQLCAKWMPRKGPVANELRKFFKLTPKQYRKLLVHSSNTVEQHMCAKEFDQINYEQVPSVAALRYQKSFTRNDEIRYGEYRKALLTGEAKINSAALFPHNITQQITRSTDRDDLLTAQWNSLPNFMADSKERILPIIDVSGSMQCSVGGNHNLNCMDVAVGLGAYVALKQPGEFNGVYLTFESQPQLKKLNPADGICQMLRNVYDDPWGGSTNITAAMKKILEYAVAHKVEQHEMPTMMVVLSDMQFDSYGNHTASSMIDSMFFQYGYTAPKVVWWDLNASYGSTPCGATQPGMFAVSGFSPAILKAIVNQEELPPVPTAYDLMMAVIGSERYERVVV